MIIVVCTDDPSLVHIATQTSQGDHDAFGDAYQVFYGTDPIPLLGVHEDLFLIAHGAYNGDDGNPVIGDESQDFYVNAPELYINLNGNEGQGLDIFPDDYDGNVYVDACESADHTASTFSFTEVFLAQIQADFGNTQVYGRNGTVSGLIPAPTDASWQQAS